MKTNLPCLLLFLLFVTNTAVAGDIHGTVLGHDNKPVPNATVVLCDQRTGIPVSKTTFRPFTETGEKGMKELATTLTDANGTFTFTDVNSGEFRILVQSWPDKKGVTDVFAKNGKRILLHGIATEINVEDGKTSQVQIKPLGNCALSLDEKFGNDGTLFIISTKPLTYDAALGFIAWEGAFLQNMIGANRMLSGYTEVAGLPERELYMSVFSIDNNGGIGEGSVKTVKGKTVKADYIPVVCGWSNGRHQPPEKLKETFTEIKTLSAKTSVSQLIRQLLEKNGIVLDLSKKKRNPMYYYLDHLDKKVSLPSGKETRLADILACIQYLRLQAYREKRKRK